MSHILLGTFHRKDLEGVFEASRKFPAALIRSAGYIHFAGLVPQTPRKASHGAIPWEFSVPGY